MFIPMWAILLFLCLISPDLAFILAIIFCIIKYPWYAVLIGLIFLVGKLISVGCIYFEEKIAPKMEKITESKIYKNLSFYIIKTFVWFIYGLIALSVIALFYYLIAG